MNDKRERIRESLLSVRDLRFSYEKGHADVFRDISFTVEPGEVFLILGANGAGKSTLLNCITGAVSGWRGSIRLQGRDIREVSPRDKALCMGYVPQLSMPTFNYTVRDYVVMGRAPYIGLMGTPDERQYAVADRVIREMGIEKLSDKLITRISGGERQQVQIARVLAQEARLVILDEPTNHLDFGNQLKILRIIREMSRAGLAVILTTHMPDHAFLLRGKTGILGGDGTMRTGQTGEIVTEAALRELYNTDLRLIRVEELGREICAVGRDAGLD